VESSSTQREVTENRPDITIQHKKEKTCILIDVAIPAGRNVLQKEVEKMLKYKRFMYRDTTNREPEKNKIIPVKIGATEIVTQGLRKNLEVIPGKHSIDSLHETAILGTSHIIQKVLQPEI